MTDAEHEDMVRAALERVLVQHADALKPDEGHVMSYREWAEESLRQAQNSSDAYDRKCLMDEAKIYALLGILGELSERVKSDA